MLVSHVGESTEADGGGAGVFSLKLRGNLSVCDKTAFQHGGFGDFCSLSSFVVHYVSKE